MRKNIILICEGDSEYAYIQQLQRLFGQHTTENFLVPLTFTPKISAGGYMHIVRPCFRQIKKDNPRSHIEVWVDFDIYHRNDQSSRDEYRKRKPRMPVFQFSYHNFEDFLVLHYSAENVNEWNSVFSQSQHYQNPLHGKEYMPLFAKVFPNYKKGSLPADFVTIESLLNLKYNLTNRIIPPSSDANFGDFAVFLLDEIQSAFPNLLS